MNQPIVPPHVPTPWPRPAPVRGMARIVLGAGAGVVLGAVGGAVYGSLATVLFGALAGCVAGLAAAARWAEAAG